jgi:FMN reductase
MNDPVALVVVSSGESPTSKTRALAVAALEQGGGALLIELSELPADALLGRRQDDALDAAVAAASAATVLVLATPIYRATYSGVLKAFLDRFATGALTNTAVVLIASAGSPAHFLALDTGGRSVVASLGGWTVPTVVYATGADFTDGTPSDTVLSSLTAALDEAWSIADRRPSPPPAGAG